jgi:peroxiredoxin
VSLKKASDVCPLLPRESVPEVEVKNLTGETIALKKNFGSKPRVLIFYHGCWCPYCNLHLAELQSIEKDILNVGYQIVAVSPDSPQNLKASLEEDKLNYHLFSDTGMKVA